MAADFSSDAISIPPIILTLAIGLAVASSIYIFIFQKTSSLAVSSTPLGVSPTPTTSTPPPSESDHPSKSKNQHKHVAKAKSQTLIASKHSAKPSHEKFLCQLKGHLETVSGVAFSDEFLVSVSGDRTIRLWERSSFERKDSNFIPKVHKVAQEGDSPTLVAVTPDAKRIAVSTYNSQSIRIYSRSDASKPGSYTMLGDEFPNHHRKDIIDVGIGAKGAWVMSCSSDTTLNVWDSAGELIQSIATNAVNNYIARVSPDGKFIALGGFMSDVKVWEVGQSKGHGSHGQLSSSKKHVTAVSTSTSSQAVFHAFSLHGHTRGVTLVAFSSLAKRMLTVSKDESVKLWNIDVRYHMNEDAKIIKSTPISEIGVFNIDHAELSPNGDFAIFAIGSSIRVWNIMEGKMVLEIDHVHSQNVKQMCLSNDGRHLATIGNGTKEIHVWDMSGVF
ncbi:Transducin beta-like protein 2 [Blyttiomyces sp. JEL0837]|nr:Transducin beta-like protein 2 [Blyttiomyces sp. JEL0837]